MTFHVGALVWFFVWVATGGDARALYCCVLCVLVAPVRLHTRKLP